MNPLTKFLLAHFRYLFFARTMSLTLEYSSKTKDYENVGKRPLANANENQKKRVKLDPGIKVELPDEMWMKIMGYLDYMDLFQNISLICKHFYNIHRSSAKYLEVKRLERRQHFLTAIKVLSDCKSLKTLRIEVKSFNMSYMDAIIKQALISCQNVKTLKVFSDQDRYLNDKFRTKPCLSMKTIGTLGKKLEHLVLHDIQIEETDFLSNLIELKSLGLTSLTQRPEEILSLSKFWPKLEAINFVDFPMSVGEELISFLAAELNSFFSKKAPKQKELSLMTYYERFLHHCSSSFYDIEKLTAHGAFLTEKGLQYISNMPNLKSIVLHDINSSVTFLDPYIIKHGEALKSFFKNMNGKNLHCLVLSDCKGFDVSAFEELSKQHYPELEALYISQLSNIENPEAIIKKLVQNCPKLNHIHLKGGFSNISNQFLLDLLKDFNVRITIEGKVLSSGKKYISKKKFFEAYLKKHDFQSYEKYKQMELQSKWLAK